VSEAIKAYQIISTFYPSIGGTQRATGTLSRGLILQGCNVEVLTAWSSGLSRHEVIQTTSVRRLGFGGPGKLRSLTFGLHTFYWVVRHGRSTPLIHTQNIDTPLLVGILLKLLARKRWVATIHGGHHIPDKRRTLLGRFRLCLMRRLVDHFIAISEENRQVILEEGISPECISLIPNGLDVDFFRPPQPEERQALRARHGYGPDDIVVLYLGRLVFSKRADLLLRAFAGLGQKSAAKCIIVGDGPEIDNLQTLAEKLGLGVQVRFMGPVDNVRDFYWSSDVFVIPSMYEGLSVGLLESMACSMAVLVTKCPGNLQVVEDGVNGLTCNIDDLDALSCQLKRLIEDADLRSALGTEARRSILAEYSMLAVSEAHLRVYAHLVGRSGIGKIIS